jgi:hypothetical protein
MKRLLFVIAACSLLLGAVSCTRERVERPASDEGVISFRPVLGKQTRASETTLITLEADAAAQLVVNAYPANDATLFNEFVLTHDDAALSGHWTYSPVVSQPGYLLRYYSVYPAVTGTATATDYSFNYTVKATYDIQEDLLAASVEPTLLETIDLQYSHLLSQVNFAVQGMEDVKIEIADITLSKILSTSTYTFSTGWGTPSTTASYVYDPLQVSLVNLASGTSTDIEYLGNGGGEYGNNNALMLMPQTFDPENGGEDGTLSFGFTLTVDLDNDGDFTDTPDGAKVFSDTALVNLSDFEQLVWAPGKRYVYVIDFTGYIAGGPINFNVSVDEWEDATNSAQTVQIATATNISVEAAIILQSQANAANTALTVFPISIGEDFAEVIDITSIYGFDAGDVIRIECVSAAETADLTLSAAGWTREVVGRIVVLTCTTPTVQGAEVTADLTSAVDDATLAAAIDAAISTIAATGSATVSTEYTVIVGKDFAAAGSALTPVPASGDFFSGDVIRLKFPNTNANNVVVANGWTVTTNGMMVILTKE